MPPEKNIVIRKIPVNTFKKGISWRVMVYAARQHTTRW